MTIERSRISWQVLPLPVLNRPAQKAYWLIRDLGTASSNATVMPEFLQNFVMPQTGGTSTEANLDFTAARMSELPASPPAEDSSSGTSTPPRDRDSTWLQVEACRDFRRDTCPRGDQCRFAHPDAKIIGKDGKVTCCYDFLKGRCHRDYCKYYHPPTHIKDRLVNAGKQFGAMMSRAPVYPAMPQFIPDDVYGLKPAAVGPVLFPHGPGPRGYPEKVFICQDFVLGQCQAAVCALAHPGPYVHHNVDQTVTVCRNFMNGMCMRGDKCRYYHLTPLYWPQQHPLMTPPTQGYPMGHPAAAMFPVCFPAPPQGMPFIPMGLFPAVPPHSPVSVATSPLVPCSVPMAPVVSPGLAANTSMPSQFIPAQPVMVPATPVSVIESSATAATAAVNYSGGEESNFTTVSSIQQVT